MYKISYKSLLETKTDWLNFTARFCFQVSLIIGLVGIIGWIFDFRDLLSIDSDFLPIAPDTSILIFLLSSVLFYNTFNKTNRFAGIAGKVLVYFLIFYTTLKIIDFFLQTDLTLSNIIFPSTEYKGEFPVKRISPLTSFLLLLSGAASIMILSGKLRSRNFNVISILGSTILIFGFIITTGYSFGTPLFYGGNIIPVALPTAIGLTLIGIGITAAAGPESITNRLFTGTAVRALLLRAFIPIIIIAVLLVGFIHQMLVFTNLNEGLIASLTTLIFIALTIFVSIKIAVKISGVIEKAEAERKKAEVTLKENLVEKETLLKELNHRVKNNFNLINSIIELSTANKTDKEDLLASISVVKRRILTISMIHKQLYDSKEYSNIDFRRYILNLARSVHDANENNMKIDLHFDIDDIHLPITKAIPCGLIINEMLTNSFKYAFKGNNSGNIYITFKNSDGSVKLTIKDDGKGLPDKFSLDNSETMGYTIVNELSKQLDGKSEISSNGGAVFKLIFPAA